MVRIKKKNNIVQSFSIPLRLVDLVKDVEGSDFSWSKIVTRLVADQYDSDSLIDRRAKKAAREHSEIRKKIEELEIEASEKVAIIDLHNKGAKK